LEHKIPQIAKATLRIKINAEGITKPDLKHYNRTIEIKTAWYQHKTDLKTSGTE
jgi:hypothetical protein